MKKLIGWLALLLAVSQISLIIWFESFNWPLGTMLAVFYSLFLIFTQSLSYLISKNGILQTTISLLSGIQVILVIALLVKGVEIKTIWYWQFCIALISICLGMISSSLYRRISPLIHYLQYLILAIIIFCLFALGMNKISTGTITIGFSLLCLISGSIQLFTKEKSA